MENLISTIKLILPILFTPLINRFISTFRIRQLYLAFENVNACTLPSASGYIACLHIYNKGKDKEINVEISIPYATECQIIGSNDPGVSVIGNIIKIDKLFAKQIVSLTIYANAKTPISPSVKPTIRSEDCKGKSYSGKGNVPPSLGPAVLTISFLLTILTAMFASLYTNANLLYPYYTLRYNDTIKQGITPSEFSDNKLISESPLSDPSPIEVLAPSAKERTITLPVKITNITKHPIKISILTDLKNPKYDSERDRAYGENPEWEDRIAAMNIVDERYGFHKDNPLIRERVIPPNATEIINISRITLPTTKPANFNFKMYATRASYDDTEFSDHYVFNIEDSPYLLEIVDLLKATTKNASEKRKNK